MQQNHHTISTLQWHRNDRGKRLPTSFSLRWTSPAQPIWEKNPLNSSLTLPSSSFRGSSHLPGRGPQWSTVHKALVPIMYDILFLQLLYPPFSPLKVPLHVLHLEQAGNDTSTPYCTCASAGAKHFQAQLSCPPLL